MRSFSFAATILAACLISAASWAAVTPATYTFYGQVQTGSGGSNGPNPGDLVYITITVDTSFPAFTQKGNVTGYYGGAAYNLPSPILAVTVNGQNFNGIYDNVNISNDAMGKYGLQFQTFSPMGLGFNLTLSSTIKGVIHTDKIPKQVFPGNFPTRTFSVEVPPGVTYSGQIVE